MPPCTDRCNPRTRLQELVVSVSDLTGPFTASQSTEVPEEEDHVWSRLPQSAQSMVDALWIREDQIGEGCSIECHSVALREGRDHHGLDGMKSILGLVEDDTRIRLEHIMCHFDSVRHVRVFHDLTPNNSVGVVEPRKTVHELHIPVARCVHEPG